MSNSFNKAQRGFDNQLPDEVTMDCKSCKGDGNIEDEVCTFCNGSGVIQTTTRELKHMESLAREISEEWGEEDERE